MQTLRFPPAAVECRGGDYLIRLIRGGSGSPWRVFLVLDLVLLSRLIPLEGQGPLELIEERHAVDSMRPAYLDEIHLLVIEYDPVFPSAEAAAAAVGTADLGSGRSGACIPATDFPADSTHLVRPDPA
jgi:hypothetical protein